MSIIAISRGTYSGGMQLAECIAKRIGYRCLSREDLLSNAAKQFGVDEAVLAAALNNRPGLMEGKSLLRIHYVAYLRAALCKECKDDNLVYHGYVGHSFLGGISHILRVRVLADMEFRIKAVIERNKLSREEAIQHIRKMDQERVQWVKSIYQINWLDPSLYDMVINLEHMSIDRACGLLAYATETIFPTTDESRQVMNDMALATDIRARIASLDRIDLHGGIKDYEIEVAADDGIITISGKVNSVEEAKRIINVASETPGAKEIKTDMHVRTSGRYDFP